MEDIEEKDFVASDQHDRLVSAVSKFDKTQHIREPTRNELFLKRSSKLDLNKVVKVLKDTPHYSQIGKKLKKSQEKSKVLSKPLEKPQVERIKRATGYEETKEKLSRWDPVVAKSRSEDYVTFPLKNVSTKLQPADEFISKFKLKSSLEKALEEIDPPIVEDVEEDEDQVYPMSYMEMVEHRQHLAKLRAQQSYKASKAKRQSKIKSKKYHRILKKERLKQQLKEFELLQKENPEEALKKLEAIEKARALERHTLRHKNTGKWAKNQMIRAKYDKDVRQQIAEQLAVSRSLTKKVQDTESSDDEVDNNEVIPDITLAQDPMNPWMLKRSDKSNVDAEFDFGYKKYLKDKFSKKKHDSDTDSSNENESQGNKPSENNLMVLKDSIKKINQQESVNDGKIDDEVVIKPPQNQFKKNINTKKNKTDKIIPTATSNWVVESIDDVNIDSEKNITEEISLAFDSLENRAVKKVEQNLKKLRRSIQLLEKNNKSSDKEETTKEEVDNLEYLKFKNKKQKAIIDEELIETGYKNDNIQNEKNAISKILETTATPAPDNTVLNIDPKRFIEVKPKYLKTVLPKAENQLDQLDDDDDDEQVVPKVNIEEVFEEDDVVASFRQEKEDEIKNDQPGDIDLSLPGWGSWGGKGVKAPKRKKNRFILKAPPKMPRRDENKGDIIIKEFRNPQLSAHKVVEVPFPFESVKDYEASIRAPLGNTFIPEKVHKQLIRPSVITKAGTIIEPMDEEELLDPKYRNFKKMDILKLLAKK